MPEHYEIAEINEKSIFTKLFPIKSSYEKTENSLENHMTIYIDSDSLNLYQFHSRNQKLFSKFSNFLNTIFQKV